MSQTPNPSQTQPTTSNPQNHPIFQQYEEAKKLGGKFVKMNPGERLTLQFNLNRIEIAESEFNGKKTGGRSCHFTVIDPREPARERVLSMGAKKQKE